MSRRDKILKSSYNLFLDKGFHGTSLKDICDDAGVPLGGMYYYFKTKLDVLFHTHKEVGTNPEYILHKYQLSIDEAKEVRMAVDLIEYYRDEFNDNEGGDE